MVNFQAYNLSRMMEIKIDDDFTLNVLEEEEEKPNIKIEHFADTRLDTNQATLTRLESTATEKSVDIKTEPDLSLTDAQKFNGILNTSIKIETSIHNTSESLCFEDCPQDRQPSAISEESGVSNANLLHSKNVKETNKIYEIKNERDLTPVNKIIDEVAPEKIKESVDIPVVDLTDSEDCVLVSVITTGSQFTAVTNNLSDYKNIVDNVGNISGCTNSKQYQENKLVTQEVNNNLFNVNKETAAFLRVCADLQKESNFSIKSNGEHRNRSTVVNNFISKNDVTGSPVRDDVPSAIDLTAEKPLSTSEAFKSSKDTQQEKDNLCKKNDSKAAQVISMPKPDITKLFLYTPAKPPQVPKKDPPHNQNSSNIHTAGTQKDDKILASTSSNKPEHKARERKNSNEQKKCSKNASPKKQKKEKKKEVLSTNEDLDAAKTMEQLIAENFRENQFVLDGTLKGGKNDQLSKKAKTVGKAKTQKSPQKKAKSSSNNTVNKRVKLASSEDESVTSKTANQLSLGSESKEVDNNKKIVNLLRNLLQEENADEKEKIAKVLGNLLNEDSEKIIPTTSLSVASSMIADGQKLTKNKTEEKKSDSLPQKDVSTKEIPSTTPSTFGSQAKPRCNDVRATENSRILNDITIELVNPVKTTSSNKQKGCGSVEKRSTNKASTAFNRVEKQSLPKITVPDSIQCTIQNFTPTGVMCNEVAVSFPSATISKSTSNQQNVEVANMSRNRGTVIIHNPPEASSKVCVTPSRSGTERRVHFEASNIISSEPNSSACSNSGTFVSSNTAGRPPGCRLEDMMSNDQTKSSKVPKSLHQRRNTVTTCGFSESDSTPKRLSVDDRMSESRVGYHPPDLEKRDSSRVPSNSVVNYGGNLQEDNVNAQSLNDIVQNWKNWLMRQEMLNSPSNETGSRNDLEKGRFPRKTSDFYVRSGSRNEASTGQKTPEPSSRKRVSSCEDRSGNQQSQKKRMEASDRVTMNNRTYFNPYDLSQHRHQIPTSSRNDPVVSNPKPYDLSQGRNHSLAYTSNEPNTRPMVDGRNCFNVSPVNNRKQNGESQSRNQNYLGYSGGRSPVTTPDVRNPRPTVTHYKPSSSTKPRHNSEGQSRNQNYLSQNERRYPPSGAPNTKSNNAKRKYDGENPNLTPAQKRRRADNQTRNQNSELNRNYCFGTIQAESPNEVDRFIQLMFSASANDPSLSWSQFQLARQQYQNQNGRWGI